MAKLYTKISLYAESYGVFNLDYKKDLRLLDLSDGNGPKIVEWNVDGLSKPTDEQLESYETAGNAVEAELVIDATRRSQYGTWQQQMEMIYKDQKNGTTTFKDHCDKVRSDNPKD